MTERMDFLLSREVNRSTRKINGIIERYGNMLAVVINVVHSVEIDRGITDLKELHSSVLKVCHGPAPAYVQTLRCAPALRSHGGVALLTAFAFGIGSGTMPFIGWSFENAMLALASIHREDQLEAALEDFTDRCIH